MKIKDIILQDDETQTGGISHTGETLGEFMDEVGLTDMDTFETINNALTECGIKEIY